MNLREVLVRLMLIKDRYKQMLSDAEQEALSKALEIVQNAIYTEDDLK